MVDFVYLTINPDRSHSFCGEDYLLHSLLKDKVNFIDGARALDGLGGAIVSIKGCDELKHADELNRELAKLKWCVVIVKGNENSTGFYKLIKHPNCKIWVQTPKAEDTADYYLGFGTPSEVLEIQVPKTLNFFFAGQDTHRRRHECLAVLDKLSGGLVLRTLSFGQGLPYLEYLQAMRNAKVIPCPAGAATPDTFRVYEALECGSIPVVDAQRGVGEFEGDYWRKVWGDVPFPIVQNWKEFPAILDSLLLQWDTKAPEVFSWWKLKKEQIVKDLFQQISTLL